MKKGRNAIVLVGITLLMAGGVFAAGEPNSNVGSLTAGDNANLDQATGTQLASPIRIVQPTENARLPQLSSTYVCGSVAARGKLTINGVPVSLHPDGGFVAMVDLKPGVFAIKAELIVDDVAYQATRNVVVAEPKQAVTGLTIESVMPGQDQEVMPGDWVEVVCYGSPGLQGYFTLKGIYGRFALTETLAGESGIYRGGFRVATRGLRSQATIKATLVDKSRNRKISKEAPGKLSLFTTGAIVMAEVIAPDAVLRTGPALSSEDKAGYRMFPPIGTILQLTGRKDNEYRVRLSPTQTVWITATQVKRLPEGTSDAPVAIGDVGAEATANAALIKIPLERKLPFAIETDAAGERLDLSLYGAFSNTDRIANRAGQTLKQLSWYQDSETTYRLRVVTPANSWWGYDTRYEGNVLVIELRLPPPVSKNLSALEGLIIAVDAGHGSSGGAIGCTGYAEGAANLAMALDLKAKLEAKGVKVILTRPGKEDVALGERPKIALQNKADLLISLHNNSMGAGGNPLQKHGFELYYFTPQSLDLARAIHEAYAVTFGSKTEFTLSDNGLYYGNLALTRATQIPSVLIESAYMIVPQEEAYLKNAAFRSKCSEAIISGLERYAERMRPKNGGQ